MEEMRAHYPTGPNLPRGLEAQLKSESKPRRWLNFENYPVDIIDFLYQRNYTDFEIHVLSTEPVRAMASIH